MADSKQREIKFRAWCNGDKRFYYLDHFWNEWWYDIPCDGTGKGRGSVLNDNMHMGRRSVVLEQFTGLQSKNGKDIFEGDVMNCIYLFDGCKKHKLLIEFDNDYALFRTRNIGECHQPGVRKTMRDMTASEIIGNVHEHPELLGVSND